MRTVGLEWRWTAVKEVFFPDTKLSEGSLATIDDFDRDRTTRFRVCDNFGPGKPFIKNRDGVIEGLRRKVCIALRHSQVFVTEQFLHASDLGPALNKLYLRNGGEDHGCGNPRSRHDGMRR